MCAKYCHIRKELTTWPKYATEAPDQSGNTRDFHMSAVPLTEESFLQTCRTVDGRNPAPLGVEALSTTQFFTSWRCTFCFAGLQGNVPRISPRFHSTTLPERMGFLLNCMSFVKLEICLRLLQFNERSWLMIDVSDSWFHFVPKVEGTNSVRTSLHPLSNLLPARCRFRSSIYNRFNWFLLDFFLCIPCVMAPSQFALEAQRWHPPRLFESGGQGKALVCHLTSVLSKYSLSFFLPASPCCCWFCISYYRKTWQTISRPHYVIPLNYEISGCECLKIGELSKRLEMIHLRRSCFGD